MISTADANLNTPSDHVAGGVCCRIVVAVDEHHQSSPTDLRGSRTSSRWSSLPGSWDVLNLRAVFPGDAFGFPVLPPAHSEQPVSLVSYVDRFRLSSPRPGDCVHFFLDDYRFEVVWRQPVKCLSRVQRAGWALTPDFSLYPEMPRVVQMWNVYRSRWCGAWWLSQGVRVIPTVSWSDEASFEFAFAGLSPGGMVAVSTVGIAAASAVEQCRFAAGLEQLIHLVAPSRVLVYGCRVPVLAGVEVDMSFYPARRNR